ncbi:hypothetical protein [Salinibacter grassmerensis]|nr:hypothetical protein [Salinibacter grassmerensis]
MTLFGLPLGTAAALAVVGSLPLLAYVLYRIDARGADGHVTVLGHRPSDS